MKKLCIYYLICVHNPVYIQMKWLLLFGRRYVEFDP